LSPEKLHLDHAANQERFLFSLYFVSFIDFLFLFFDVFINNMLKIFFSLYAR